MSARMDLVLSKPGLRDILEGHSVGQISNDDKIQILGFFEEISILMNSGLIAKEVAYYMFGYYAMRCLACRSFIDGINLESPYWQEFVRFTQTMQEMEESSFNSHPMLSFARSSERSR